MHTFECYIAEPDSNQTHEEPLLPDDTAIVLGTPVASRIYQNGNILGGDTGVRAQALANKFGRKVIAWQDLGPKVRFPGLLAARNRMTAANFDEYADESADMVAKVLQSQDIGRTVMRVHSGMGPLGTHLTIALHARPDLSVSHLAISDPVGLQQVSFLDGWRRVQAYNNGAAKQTPLDHRNNDPDHPRNTLASFLADVVVRGTTVWTTDTTHRNLIRIGNDQPDTAVLLHLPGNTLNGTPEEAEALALNIQRQVARSDGTFRVQFGPSDYHSTTYDNLDRNVRFITDAVDLAPFKQPEIG